MCKHILINDFQSNDVKYIKEFVSKAYEKDGYGSIIRMKDGSIVTIKSLDIALFYLDIMEVIGSNQVKDLVLHHRTSTNKPGLDYAHPFEYDGNFLTHNGVVTVPGIHTTLTENDSEKLLHHLIKTDFETMSVQGYFSCFIFNDYETIILVDDTAPIYSDGRIYSSINLGDSMEKIVLQKITRNQDGVTSIPIQVTKTDYGQDKAYLSLSTNDYKSGVFKDYIMGEVEYFYDSLHMNDEFRFSNCHDIYELKQEILIHCDQLDIRLTPEELTEVIEYFSFEMNYMNRKKSVRY